MFLIVVGVILFIVVVAAFITTDNLSQLGANPKGTRLERIRQSPQYNGRKFVNLVQTNLSVELAGYREMMSKWLFGKEIREPKGDIPIVHLDSSSFQNYQNDDLRVTWLGHSTALIEIDGYRILTDPVWSKRCSPSSLTGPARFHPVPISLDDLPALDAVLISHDHYDHLDKDVVRILAKTGVKFLVPLGVGAHLEKWKIDPSQINELDWGDRYDIADTDLQFMATPARHFSGRGMVMGSNPTLWVSWVITGPLHRVFFSGDTGEFPGLAEIGDKYGPFDLTMIKIGAYDKLWPDIHLNPEQAVGAHRALKGSVLMPIHWGTFNLAFHAWDEPPERLIDAAEPESVRIVIPRPGQIISISDPPPVERWWAGL